MIQPVFTFDKLLQRLQLDKEETPFVIWHKKTFLVHTIIR